ncbi:DNA translocase FtsK [Mannheimia pernigra]|uniref:DNA translocase FtsK n=1 Tax=Mannheimia pernigra TaxID=111844 RepID=UPI001315B3DB|nr:DNA translocase FtsK [Mannheimia pernigra]QHB16916.1 cell division protein FtsK [Mannheimia pernigra]
MSSNNLLLPIDLLEKHYNVQLPDMEKALSTLGITNANISYIVGPVVITYHIKLELDSLESNVINQLSNPAKWAEILNVRVVRMIPSDFGTLVLEVPHNHRHTISLKDVICSEAFINSNAKLPIALGVDTKGEPVVIDLTKAPHLLIGGATGAGTSVCIHTILISLLSKLDEERLKLMLIDPKVVELSLYNDIPHLITPVITDMHKATQALKWCVDEMEHRYQLLSLWGVRNIESYNQKISRLNEVGIVKDTFNPFSYIVIVIYEFADLMMVKGKLAGEYIMRIAQKARAVGIHLILATQRPKPDIMTGTIKVNIPSRIAFTVTDAADSRTILDEYGAETLLGRGDMLYFGAGSPSLTRIHGAFVSDEEIVAITDFWRMCGRQPQYQENIFTENVLSSVKDDLDPLFDDVCKFVIETKATTISAIQRNFNIGFNRAAHIMDQLEAEGIVSEPLKSGKRELLIEKN